LNSWRFAVHLKLDEKFIYYTDGLHHKVFLENSYNYPREGSTIEHGIRVTSGEK